MYGKFMVNIPYMDPMGHVKETIRRKRKTSWIYPAPRMPSSPQRILTFLVGNPNKPSFVTIAGWAVDPNHIISDYRILTQPMANHLNLGVHIP